MSTTAPHLEARSRWSSAAKCPRQGALGLLGTDPSEPDDRTRRLWIRGHQLEDYGVGLLAAKYGDDNVVRQKAIPWPGGILHSDAYVISENLPHEFKSSASPQSILDAAVTQLAGEIHFDPDATEQGKGMLGIINPIDLDITWYLVSLTDEWRAQVEAIASEVVKAGATGGEYLPPRTCENPSEGIGKFCPFIETCFQGWESPASVDANTPEMIDLAGRLHALKAEYRSHSQAAELARSGYLEVQQRLVDLGVQPKLDYLSGPFSFKRIVSKGAERFDLRAARLADVMTPELEEFVKESEPSERWMVDRVVTDGEVAAAINSDDFGDVPF